MIFVMKKLPSGTQPKVLVGDAKWRWGREFNSDPQCHFLSIKSSATHNDLQHRFTVIKLITFQVNQIIIKNVNVRWQLLMTGTKFGTRKMALKIRIRRNLG